MLIGGKGGRVYFYRLSPMKVLYFILALATSGLMWWGILELIF